MRFEDIEIRIARDGRVYVKVDGVTEEKIRSMRAWLEEEIGPIESLEIIQKPDWDQPAIWTAEEKHDQASLDIDWDE